MYNLCKIDTSCSDSSAFGHPLNVIFQSENFTEISEEIEKHVSGGCRPDMLKIFSEVHFSINIGVHYVGY